MANKLNFTGWSGKTDFLSGSTINFTTLNNNNSQRSVSSNNTNNAPQLYSLNLNYDYTYLIQACAQPLEGETITYIVGSDTELNVTGTSVYSFQSIINPSITVCGFILDEPFSGDPEYVLVNTYTDCVAAYTSNYKLAVVVDCLTNEPQDFFTNYIPVDNKYEIGDILYVDFLATTMGTAFVKFAGTIVDIVDWSQTDGPYWDTIPAVNYVTYSSCDEAIEANGLIYVAINCITEEASFPLIHKNYFQNTSLLIPTTGNPVNVLVDYLPYGPYGEAISGGSEIYSTVEFTGSENYNSLCEEGLSKISPEGVLNPFFQNTGFTGSFVYTTVEQPDGKLLVGGQFDIYDNNIVNNFMRLDSNGNVDETFNNNDKLLLNNPDAPVSIIKQQGYIFTLDHSSNVINVSKIVNNKMVSVISNYDTTSFVPGGFPWQIYGDGTNLYVVFDNAGIGVWRFNTGFETLEFITKTEGHFCEQYSQIWGDGDYIYASTASSDGGNQTLKAFQLMGTSINVVGEWEEIYSYNSVYCQDGYIFVGVPFSGLYVITFNGTTFTEIISTPNTGDIVAVNGDTQGLIYVLDGSGTLKQYQLNVPQY